MRRCEREDHVSQREASYSTPMRDLFRRLAGGSGESRGTPIPGAPFTREELPALLGEHGGLAEFVAGRSDTVLPEFGTLPLVEAGLWLTLMNDPARARGAFEAAASNELRDAQLGSTAGVVMARLEALPVSSGAKADTYLSLAGDANRARDVWLQALAQYEPVAFGDDASEDLTDNAARSWLLWEDRLDEIDQAEPGTAERAREDEPLDPAKLGMMSVFLALAALRVDQAERARRLLEWDSALAAAAPRARSRKHYHMFMVDMLSDILHALGESASLPSLEKAARKYLATRHPEALAITLDLQRALPLSMPALLPPADLTEALSAYARKRLTEKQQSQGKR
jgi:hypothetical protein